MDQLDAVFALKILGQVHHFLSIEVTRTSTGGIHLCQTKYIQDLLIKTGLQHAKLAKTPMSTGTKLVKATNDHFTDPTLYRSTTGALQYATITRPDISYAVSKLSQYMAQPLKIHWQACKKVLRFLKGISNHGLQFIPGDLSDLIAYSDADWGCDLDDRKSIRGFCIYYSIWSHEAQRNTKWWFASA